MTNNKTKKNDRLEIPIEYKEIYQLLEQKVGNVNEISRILSRNIADINSVITMMELEGYIEKLPANQFKIKEEKDG